MLSVMAVTTVQYILTGVVAAGVAFWYDFNNWKDSGARYSSQYHQNQLPDKFQELEARHRPSNTI